MTLLLDTHTFIWFLNGDKKLSPNAKNAIIDTRNRCFISVASLWEIAIKLSLKKLKLKSTFNAIAPILEDNLIEILPLTFDHLQHLLKLEYYHRDPFDRIMIAQAMAENLTIIGKDEDFRLYKVKLIW